MIRAICVPAGRIFWAAVLSLVGVLFCMSGRAAEGPAKDQEAEKLEQEITRLKQELAELESTIQRLNDRAKSTRKELSDLQRELDKLKSQPDKDAQAKAKEEELTKKAQTVREALERVEKEAEQVKKLAKEKREAKRKAELMAKKLSQEESKRKAAVAAAKRRAPSRVSSAAPSEVGAAGLSDEELLRAEQLKVARLTMPQDLPLVYVWSLPLKGDVREGDIWIRKDIVLLLANDRVLYCVRKRDGVPLWAIELVDRPQHPPAVSERMVYVVVQNRLLGIDRAAGQVVWSIAPYFTPSAPPCVSEPNLYIPGWDKRIHAVEITSRERVYVAGSGDEDALKGKEYDFRRIWHKTTGGHILATPVLDEGFLFFGSEDGYLYSVSVDGEERYKSQTQGAIRSPVTVSGGNVYVGSADFNAYSFDRLTGQLRWAFPAGSDILQPIYGDVAAGLAVVCSNKNGIFGVQEKPGPERGSQLWHIPDGEYIAGVSQDTLYMALTDKRLAAVEKKTGMVRWISLLDGIREVIPNINDWKNDPMRLFCLSTTGALVCLKEREEDLRRALEERK